MKKLGIFLMGFILVSMGMKAETEKTMELKFTDSDFQVSYTGTNSVNAETGELSLGANASCAWDRYYAAEKFDLSGSTNFVVKLKEAATQDLFVMLSTDGFWGTVGADGTGYVGTLAAGQTELSIPLSGLKNNQEGKTKNGETIDLTKINMINLWTGGGGAAYTYKVDAVYAEKVSETAPAAGTEKLSFSLSDATKEWNGDKLSISGNTLTYDNGEDFGNAAVTWPVTDISGYDRLVLELDEASTAGIEVCVLPYGFWGPKFMQILEAGQTKLSITLAGLAITNDANDEHPVGEVVDLTNAGQLMIRTSFTTAQVIKIKDFYLEKDAEQTPDTPVTPDTPDTPTTGDFAITIDNMVNGTVTASAESANEGTTITLTVVPADGYKLKDLYVEVLASPEEADVIVSNARRRAPENMPVVGDFITPALQADGTYTFAMPAHDVLVSALFKEKTLEPTLSYDKPTRTITLTNTEYSTDGTLHYTLNGAAEQTSTEETVEIVITENTTVVAWITDDDTSDEVTETFHVAAMPTVSYTDGENTVALALTAATATNTADATLYYTTDGSEPTTSSPSLTANASIDITKDMTTIKVMALDADGNYSETVTQAVVYARYLTIGKEWATFYSPETFTLPEGVEAYTISSVNAPADGESGTVTLKEQTVIAKNTPMMIRNTQAATTTKFRVYTTDDAEISASDMCSEFKGASESTTFTDDGNIRYILTNGVFLRSTTGTLPAYNCYLELSAGSPAAGARRFSVVFVEGETTGIDTLNNLTVLQSDDCVYDLSGRQLSNSQIKKGIYILNGKKVIIK